MRFAFRPLQKWSINQGFGANRVCTDIATSSKYINCDGNNPPEGYRSVYGAKGHEGLDLYAPSWTPFYFCYDGRVIEKVQDERRGWGVGVLHYENKQFYKSRYWHLCAIDVDLNEEVKMGDFGGYCDNTGVSSGSHLHFEIGTCDMFGNNYQPIDPETVLYPTFAVDAKTTIAKIRERIAIILDLLSDFARNR